MLKLTDTISLYSRADWRARDPRPMDYQGWDAHEAFLHHSADALPEAYYDLERQKAKMQSIQNYHMDTKGWSDIAYHFVIFQPYGSIPYARIFQGRERCWVPAAQEGHNFGTLPICVVGDFTPGHDWLQRNTRYAIEVLLNYYPKLTTLGLHRDVYQTECPGDNIAGQLQPILDATNLRRFKP